MKEIFLDHKNADFVFLFSYDSHMDFERAFSSWKNMYIDKISKKFVIAEFCGYDPISARPGGSTSYFEIAPEDFERILSKQKPEIFEEFKKNWKNYSEEDYQFKGELKK